MLRACFQNEIQISFPVSERLFRPAEDEIQAEIIEPGLTRCSYALYWRLRTMGAPEHPQPVPGLCLHADAQTIHTGSPDRCQVPGFQSFRVGFHRDFSIRIDIE